MNLSRTYFRSDDREMRKKYPRGSKCGYYVMRLRDCSEWRDLWPLAKLKFVHLLVRVTKRFCLDALLNWAMEPTPSERRFPSANSAKRCAEKNQNCCWCERSVVP